MLIAPLAEVLAGTGAAGHRSRSFDDEVTDVEHRRRDALPARQPRHAARPRAASERASAPDIAHATEIVPQGEWVIEELHLARDGLYLRMLDGGISRLQAPRARRAPRRDRAALRWHAGRDQHQRDSRTAALFSLTGWLTPADIWSVDAAGHVADTGLTPKPAIDVSPYETKRLFATATRRHASALHAHLPQGPEARRQQPGLHLRLRLLRQRPLHAGVRRPHARAHRCGLHRRLRQRARRRRVRARLAQGRTARQQAQHLARPHRRVPGPVRARYTAPAHLAIGGRSAGGITVGRALDRAPGPVRRGGRRRRLVQPAALRGRAERLRRGARVGRDHARSPATGR